jgi:hypothetical protein
MKKGRNPLMGAINLEVHYSQFALTDFETDGPTMSNALKKEFPRKRPVSTSSSREKTLQPNRCIQFQCLQFPPTRKALLNISLSVAVSSILLLT